MAKTAVLLPVYNGEKFLRECIDSILFQSHKEFALIICDDFSSDGSLEILQRYAAVDSRIKILHNNQNLGIAATRNKLLQALPAECDFIAIMDADDVMFPERLEQQLGYLEEHPDIAAVGTALEIIDEQGRNVGYRKYPTSSDDLRKNILKSNPISQSSLMLRRKVIDAIGLYRTDMAVCEDYDYWLRAMLKFDFVNLPHPLTRYRISSGQSKSTKLKETLKNSLRLNKTYLFNPKYFTLTAIFYFIAKSVLYLLPGSWIMILFEYLTYRKDKE